MVVILLINLILLIFGTIFSFLPVVTIADIPFIGQGVSEILTSMVQYYNTFAETFPYAETGMQIFLKVIIPFELLMLIAKFFFGNRVPANMQ